jgi:kynurenine formamidase
MWNGRDPDREVDEEDGSRYADIETLGDGIVTRGVLLDIPRHRGVPYVTPEEPVTGDELADVAVATGIEIEPGDAVVVHSGRERFSAVNTPWGAGSLDVSTSTRPGLHVSCLPFLREVDAALLVWDMMDLRPNGFDLAFAVHAAIWALGIALVDNALLEPLALVCAEERRWEFQLIVAPLRVKGGSGSPVNPLAVL